MKEIIIPETDNRGDGKIKFILQDDEKIFFEILDKKKNILNYSLEFRIREGNLIDKNIRDIQQNFIRSLCKAHSKDKENAILLYREAKISEDIFYENCFYFKIFIGSSFFDAYITSEESRGELNEKVLPLCFSLLKEGFENRILTSFKMS